MHIETEIDEKYEEIEFHVCNHAATDACSIPVRLGTAPYESVQKMIKSV